MDQIAQTENLNAHYTNNPKVVKPQHVVVTGPDNVPKYHIFTDREANMRLAALNNDVYVSVKNTPKKDPKKKFLGIF